MVLHYKRADENYDGWNAWVWTMNRGGTQYNLAKVDGEMVATFTVDSLAHSYVSFILRKGEWEEQEFGERRISLSTVISGTIHCYVTSGKEACTEKLSADAVVGAKLLRANFDYESGKVQVETSMPVEGNLKDAFSVTGGLTVTDIARQGNIYTLTLNEKPDLVYLYHHKVCFHGNAYAIGTQGLYASKNTWRIWCF